MFKNFKNSFVYFVMFFISLTLLISLGCGKSKSRNDSLSNKNQSGEDQEKIKSLENESAENRARIEELERQLSETQNGMTLREGESKEKAEELKRIIADLEARLNANQGLTTAEIAKLKTELEKATADLASMTRSEDDLRAEINSLKSFVDSLERKILEKLSANNLLTANKKILQDMLGDHTTLYRLSGQFNVLVIPVEFSDRKFDNREFIEKEAQEYIFGNNPGSLSTFYRHESGGKFKISGVVTAPVVVDKPLQYYGQQEGPSHDIHARDLVVDALVRVRERMASNPSWWDQFDLWDINDYDGDRNFYEKDGFADAVVLIYAGKEQATCARLFTDEEYLNASSPRHAAAVECYDRIWPHRSAVFLAEGHPERPTTGPLVEGISREAFGVRITERLYAFDYNMQSEYSDISTFCHEFGHSLTLPDVYATNAGDNSTGMWELMSNNARLQGQEISSYNKMAIGWMSPKIVRAGEQTSLYLGNYSFVDYMKRDDRRVMEEGLDFVREAIQGNLFSYDILSVVPGTDENVYKSAIVIAKPYKETIKLIDFPDFVGKRAAYSGKKDGLNRSIIVRLKVPTEGNVTLTFDALWAVETETNFESPVETIKVLENYDVGLVKINGKPIDNILQTISGDENFNTLAEKNPDCPEAEVLTLRKKKLITHDITEEETKRYEDIKAICKKPIWVKMSYDLSKAPNGQDYRGQEIEFAVSYVTDGGVTELGIMVDNFKFGDTLINDFETASVNPGDVVPPGEFILIENGIWLKEHQPFYFLEYRDPLQEYKNVDESVSSFNMDKNIAIANAQAMFLPPAEGLTMRDRFRVVTTTYQPGVLVWYFNPRFDQRQNSPIEQNSQGYYLVVNSAVKEMPLPSVLGTADLFDSNGYYAVKSDVYKQRVAEQRNQFVCYSNIAYATYSNGVAPDCSSVDPAFLDDMQKLEFKGKKLRFRRESFNDFPAAQQAQQFSVAEPFWGVDAAVILRTSLSTFRPAEMGEFAPFKVYKVAKGTNQLVLDEEMTTATKKFAPVSGFKDVDSTHGVWWQKHERFGQDSTVVEPSGFKFAVGSPSPAVTSRFTSDIPEDINHTYRKPIVKIYFAWE